MPRYSYDKNRTFLSGCLYFCKSGLAFLPELCLLSDILLPSQPGEVHSNSGHQFCGNINDVKENRFTFKVR